MSQNVVFVPHLTEIWAPVKLQDTISPNESFSCTLVDPCDRATIGDAGLLTYDSALWHRLKQIPGHEALPAFKDAASVIYTVLDSLAGDDNITKMNLVCEASILHSIRNRYKRQIVYTNVGQVVIAMNPFKLLPDLYNKTMAKKYASAEQPFLLPPHIYQISAAAFQGTVKRNVDQCILITGESGAGKTESTKLVIKYFAEASVSGKPREDAGAPTVTVAEQIMMANPILESFGNASTSRNANSSRFGKWIGIRLDTSDRVRGAVIQPFMLELPRVCRHLQYDRSYHIFYYVIANDLGKLTKSCDDYQYLKATAVPSDTNPVTQIHHTIDDQKMYKELLAALKTFNFTQIEETGLFNLVGAILHLGNINFNDIVVKGGEGSEISLDTLKAFTKVIDLMGLDETSLRNCLLTKTITSGRELLSIPLKASAAVAARDGLAQFIYRIFFDWLVGRINEILEPRIEAQKNIGVLDIAGFENFQINSLEQLLINLSNEKLQQNFNNNVILQEYEDYKKEGLQTLNIQFTTIDAILLLIEGKGGIIDILNEELVIPKGSEGGFLNKLTKKFGTNSCLVPSKFPGSLKFSVSHFAGVVEYSAVSWLEKNRLNPPREALQVLQSSNNAILKEICKTMPPESKTVTVAGKYRDQLRDLMQSIEKAETHYIRCIKPNPIHDPWETESREIVQQLRCAGIIEAVQIRKAGYSLRVPYDKFNTRYGLLCKTKEKNDRDTCEQVINTLKLTNSLNNEDIFYGKSKFMAKENVRLILDAAIQSILEGLKKPLEKYVDAYNKAIAEQHGMFLYPKLIFGDNVNTPEALSKECECLDTLLVDVERQIGSLDNGPLWVKRAALARNAMKNEAAIVTQLNAALKKALPLRCTPDVVSLLQTVRETAKKNEVYSDSLEKVKGLENLINEEADWEAQLQEKDTDAVSLVKVISNAERDFLTPSCHAAFQTVKGNLAKQKSIQPSCDGTHADDTLKNRKSTLYSIASSAEQPSLAITATVFSRLKSNLPSIASTGQSEALPIVRSRKAEIAKSIAKRRPLVKGDQCRGAPRAVNAQK